MADQHPTTPHAPAKSPPVGEGRSGTTTTARDLPSGLKNDLRDFEERISELLLHPLVKGTPLRAPHHLAVVAHTCGHLSDEAFVVVENRVERPVLNDLLRILRLFEQRGEPTSVERLVHRLVREPIADTMRRSAKQCLEYYSLKDMPGGVTTRLSDGSTIDPRSAFELYMNGDLFHGKDKPKRDQWRIHQNSRHEPVLYSALLHAAICKANAVIELYRLLRVHGHVRPVEGDPCARPDSAGVS